jgi:hypothetical protein
MLALILHEINTDFTQIPGLPLKFLNRDDILSLGVYSSTRKRDTKKLSLSIIKTVKKNGQHFSFLSRPLTFKP